MSLEDDAPESELHGATIFTLVAEADVDVSISDVPVVTSTVAMIIILKNPLGFMHCIRKKKTKTRLFVKLGNPTTKAQTL